MARRRSAVNGARESGWRISVAAASAAKRIAALA
jgi:hypothetical protein